MIGRLVGRLRRHRYTGEVLRTGSLCEVCRRPLWSHSQADQDLAALLRRRLTSC